MQADKVRCASVTQKGAPCKKYAITGSTHCATHCKEIPKLWELHKLPAPAELDNDKERWRTINSLIVEIQKKSGDSEGRIYIYKDGKHAHFYKIGFTSRTTKERMKEWGNPVVVRSFSVCCAERVERLIHQYLDHIRCYRYVIDDNKILSVWKNSKLPVTRQDELIHETRPPAMHKHIEWFYSRHVEKDILYVVESIIIIWLNGERLEEDENQEEELTEEEEK